MVRRIKDFIRYTLTELESYTKSENSCVKKINKIIHLNFPPYGLSNFKTTLLRVISEKKIGLYDIDLNGIILDIRNIKIIGEFGAIRFDDPTIHINIQADCYVFQPKIGSIVQGLVKLISQRQIAVIIYRVFSVPIRLLDGRSLIEMNSEIEFRIKNFDLQTSMPYIEGELLCKETSITKSKQVIKFDFDEDDNFIENNEEKIFKKPDGPTKSVCEIAADSENDEIVFSNICYLKNEEVKKLKVPKKRQTKNSQSSSNEEEVINNSPKSILKKQLKFESSSDESSSENENKASTNLKSNTNLNYSKSSNVKDKRVSLKTSFVDEENYDIKSEIEEEINDASNTNFTNGVNNNQLDIKDESSSKSSDSEDDKRIEQKKINKTGIRKSPPKKNASFLNEKADSDVSGIEISPTKKQLDIKDKSTSESSDSEDDKRIEQKKINKNGIRESPPKKNVSFLNEKADSDVSGIEISPIKIPHSNNVRKDNRNLDANNEKWNISTPKNKNYISYETTTFSSTLNCSQDVKLEIRTELETSTKINGYESEDLFDADSQTQLDPNQMNKTIKNKTPEKTKSSKKRKDSLTKLKQRKLTDFLPKHAIQNTPNLSSDDESSDESLSASSFDETVKEIVDKVKKQKFSETESENHLGNNNSKLTPIKLLNKKSKKCDLNSSMALLLKQAMEKKIKSEKLSQESNNNATTEKSIKSEEVTKKSRKRKISLNESMNDIFAKVMFKKSKKT